MNFIKRTVYFHLKKHLDKPEISLIFGPRQAGKTTIINKLQQELTQTGKQTIFLNLDVIEDRQFFESQHTLIDFIEKKAGAKKVYVFIDEISRLNNAGLFLKGLYDLKTSHKFIVTGSGSLELKADIIEPLTGRKKIFYCFPLSFTEFAALKLNIHGDDFKKLYKELTIELATQPLRRKRLIAEYLHFGGYPRVVLAQTQEEKIELMREIYTSYLEKDITLLLKVEKEIAFANLVKILASQVGNLINRSELASTLGLTEKTIEKYLYLLEKTFVINLVRPFYQNARKELVKSPKVYFTDLGFLYFAQGIRPTIERAITGSEFENACWLRLKELDPLSPAQFWRTKSGAEVDFIVIGQTNGKPIPIEAKLSFKNTLGRSFISFIKKYRPEKAFIYYYEKNQKITHRIIQHTSVYFVPYHQLPGESFPP